MWDSSEKQVIQCANTLYYRERFYVLSDLKKYLSCLDEHWYRWFRFVIAVNINGEVHQPGETEEFI